MKWSQYGRITLALVASLALGLSITACNPSFTLGFVYALTAKSNLINAYTVDSASGAITQVANSPFPSGGQYPVAAAVGSNNKWMYVVHEIDNTVVEFAIGTDGKLYAQHTYNTPGTYPISVAIDPSENFLYVLDSYAPGSNGVAPPNINPITSNNVPTQGCVVVYPISSTDGSLSTPVSDPVSSNTCFPIGAAPVLGSQPISITATANGGVYVADQGTHTVYGYSVDDTTGILTTVNSNAGYPAGVKPSAIATDPGGRFIYVADQSANQLLGYTIQGDGTLQSMGNGFATGLYPNSMVISANGLFLYATDFNANDVRIYSIDQSTGVLTSADSVLNYGTGAGPNCISIEPAYGRFIYVSNFLDNTISGFEMNPQTGGLVQVLNTPFAASAQPTCVATAANSTHPIKLAPLMKRAR